MRRFRPHRGVPAQPDGANARPVSALARSGGAGLQRLFEATDQAILAEGFAYEGDRPGLHGALARTVFRVGRDEDDWHAVTVGNQPALQVGSAQLGHVQVGDEA